MLLSTLPIVHNGIQQVSAITTTVNNAVVSNPSMWNLFWKAEFVVKAIIIALIVSSIWSWTIIIEKIIHLKKLNAAADEFEEMFWASSSLEALYERVQNKQNHPLILMFCAAMREWRHSISKGIRISASNPEWNLEQRIDRVMQLVIDKSVVNLEKNTNFLAALGSNGMIIGLFGTVLGIMHSFQSIAMQQNTNLAIVAPGIAEALFATAIGLIAAIPAAVAHNLLSTYINRYLNRLNVFANEFNAIVSRQLEEQS